MKWLIDNWFLLICALAVISVAVVAIIKFVEMPNEKQKAKLREWLVYAVTMAEQEFGSGTGRLKLRYVYDMFVQRYSWLSRLISYDDFSAMVDDALKELDNMLKNDAIKALVKGA